MAARLGLKLGEWLYSKGQISERQIDVVRYAVEIICSEFLEVLIIVFYGLSNHKVVETIVYLIFFHTLRNLFQGYHAKTIFRCLILTVGSYLITLFTFTFVTPYMIVISFVISSLIQVEYCKKKDEVMPILVSVIFWVITVVLYTKHYNVSSLTILSIVELIVSIALIPERRNYCEK